MSKRRDRMSASLSKGTTRAEESDRGQVEDHRAGEATHHQPREAERTDPGLTSSEDKGESTAILVDELCIGGEDLEDGDHRLASLLSHPLAVPLHEVEAEIEGVRVLAR